MGFMDKLVSGKELTGVKKQRSQPFVFKKFEYELQNKRESEGLNIAQRLGELQSSPFFNRIVIGENEASAYCCLTIDTIENGLKSTHFLARFGKDNNEVEAGTFDRGSNDATRGIAL